MIAVGARGEGGRGIQQRSAMCSARGGVGAAGLRSCCEFVEGRTEHATVFIRCTPFHTQYSRDQRRGMQCGDEKQINQSNCSS